MKKRWLWVLLIIGMLLMVVGTTFIVNPSLIKSVSKDKPRLSQYEVTALVKRDLTQLGIEGHKIDSVDIVSEVRYSGDGVWQGVARVSYSYQESYSFPRLTLTTIPGQPPPPTYYLATENKIISWNFYEKLYITEITKSSP